MHQDIEKLEKQLMRVIDLIYDETARNLDLAKAMDDKDSSFKAETKIEALKQCQDLLERAKQEADLEAFKTRFFDFLDLRKASLEKGIAEARAKSDIQSLIYNQIHLSVTVGPVEETFLTFYKRLKRAD